VTDEHKAKVQTAEADVRSGGHAQGEDLARLLRWGQSRGAARVLDIATGGGHTALAFSGFTPTVVATDLSLPTVGAARKLIAGQGVAGVHFAAADVDALPFRAESFGVVTCRIAAHHFPELLPALRQVARVLRRGGSFLVQDILGQDDPELSAFILEVEKRRDPSHVRSLPQREWVAFLKAAGLTVIDEGILSKVRKWDEWTERMRMSAEATADLERHVLEAPARCRDAFGFKVEHGRIESFTDRMILLRADKD